MSNAAAWRRAFASGPHVSKSRAPNRLRSLHHSMMSLVRAQEVADIRRQQFDRLVSRLYGRAAPDDLDPLLLTAEEYDKRMRGEQ